VASASSNSGKTTDFTDFTDQVYRGPNTLNLRVIRAIMWATDGGEIHGEQEKNGS
jgi:hypothetical protein